MAEVAESDDKRGIDPDTKEELSESWDLVVIALPLNCPVFGLYRLDNTHNLTMAATRH